MKTFRYVVPNAITSLGMLLGFWSIFFVIRGDHWNAAWLLLLCVLVDKMDGTAARLLDATSPLGIQMDSLSDLVTFIVAPGILWMSVLTGPSSPFTTFPMLLVPLLAVSIYVAAGALRLAKFNCDAEDPEFPGYFEGMPTTMGGATAASLYLTLHLHSSVEAAIPWIPPIIGVMGVLMVSPLLLPKLKKSKRRAMNIFQVANIAIVIPAVILRLIPEYMLLLTVGYVVVGFLWANLIEKPQSRAAQNP